MLQGPGGAAVGRDRSTTVVRSDHALRVVRCDPEIVMIRVGRVPAAKRLAAVVGAVELDIHRVQSIAALGVGRDS